MRPKTKFKVRTLSPIKVKVEMRLSHQSCALGLSTFLLNRRKKTTAKKSLPLAISLIKTWTLRQRLDTNYTLIQIFNIFNFFPDNSSGDMLGDQPTMFSSFIRYRILPSKAWHPFDLGYLHWHQDKSNFTGSPPPKVFTSQEKVPSWTSVFRTLPSMCVEYCGVE